MSAHPDSRTVARGHVRLDRPRIAPNDPASTAPNPLVDITIRLYSRASELRMCDMLVENYGELVSIQDIAVALWGSVPSDDAEWRNLKHVIGTYASRINTRLAAHDYFFTVVNVKNVGYKLIQGNPALRASGPARVHAAPKEKRQERSPEERTRLLNRYHDLIASGLTQAEACRLVRVKPRTLKTWLARY